jgi:ATP-dependent DNA helicase RecQ
MHDLPDAESLRNVLRGSFGIDSFRPGQEQVIRSLLDGRPALAVFPTGSGKSLCYQLPALMLDGLTLVISPLIALMKDQVEKLRRLGIGAARVDSTLADDEVEEIFNSITSGEIKLLYLSPERLAGSAFRKRLKGMRIPLLAVDEAHCISEWGHNFRPDYLKIARMARRMGVERVLALTATATIPVMRDIRRSFRIAAADSHRTGVLRPNLRITINPCGNHEKDIRLMEILRETEGPVIVYATTRQATEEIATMLVKHGFSATSYHAGLDPDLRASTQDSFMQNTTKIVVATIAFGMGIDKPDIRAIIHYHLPKSLEGYSQEIGRAGRDGQPARCEMLACAGDTRVLENFIHGSEPSPQALRNLLDRVLRLAAPGRLFALSPYDLSLSHDMREETVRTVLAYLELDGIIHLRGSYHDYFRVRLIHGMDKVLAGRPARERSFVSRLLGAGDSAFGSLHYRLQEIAERTGIPREKASETLLALAEAGDIRLEQRSLRSVYQTDRNWTGAVSKVIADLSCRFESRAAHEHRRIRDVTGFVQGRKCRAVMLSDYFGQRAAPPCCVCDICRGRKPVKPAPSAAPQISDDQWAAMSALRAENHAALGTPQQLARFLCGIPSPAARKAKLHLRPEYGIWEHHRFSDVRSMLEA